MSTTISEGMHRGEKRVVSVIFADVKGFTAMSEKLDPEEVREIMNQCFGLLSQVVYDHGGIVDKYVGDCLMALFGVPVAREDDALRAVQAGLKMQPVLAAFGEELARTRGFSLSMRIGINSGLVVAGDVGSTQRSEFTVMGDSVNTASRIEHEANVGKVWIGAETARLVTPYFSLKKLPLRTIRGKSRKLQLYEVEAPLSEVGPRATGLKSVFIGRQKELKALEEALRSSLEGECTVVSLVGEAGIGKSSLLARFLECLRKKSAGPKGLRYYRVTSPPQGLGPYGVFYELARKAGIADPMTLDENDPQWKDKFFLACERRIMSAALDNPSVFILEDIHFVDAGSWELLSFLINRIRRLPIMILCVYRPESEKSLYWQSAENYVSIRLKPFPKDTVLDMVDRALGKNSLTATQKESLALKTGGNPYFMTELLWHLTENGQLVRNKGSWAPAEPRLKLRIPDTVHSALISRLDQLPPPERELLRASSILGLDFQARELAELLIVPPEGGDRLEALVSKRLLTKTIRPGDCVETFSFIHGLMREACYGTLIREDRQTLHLRAALSLEKKGQDTPEALIRTADHYYHSSDAERAVAVLWKVVEFAVRRFAMDQGLLYCNRILELMGKKTSLGGVNRSSVLCRVGELHILANFPEQALERYKECLSLLAHEDPLRIYVYRKIGRIHVLTGEPDLAEKAFVEAAECDCEGGLPSETRLSIYYEIAAGRFKIGDEAGAKQWIDKVAAGVKALGRTGELPPGGDIHELIPAYSFLAD